jgi:putative MATE family efflux protein
MYNFVDTYCAGLLSTDALAGLSLSFPVFFVVLAVGSGLSQGTTALMANALGAGQPDDARRVFAQSIVLTILGGIVLSACGILAAPWLFRELGAEGVYLRTAVNYIDTILLGGDFFLLTMAINSALTAQGNTRVYRNYLIAGFLANCALNPILMWGWLGMPRLGVRGIALATVIVQIGGCIWLWRQVTKSGLCSRLRRGLFAPDLPTVKRILAQALPAALNMLTIALGIFVITRYVQQFGKEAVAAMGIATRIEQIVLMPVIGLSSSVLSLVGQNHGARLPDRVRETWTTCIRYGVGLMAAGGTLVWVFGGMAMRCFTSDPTIIAAGRGYLIAASITLAAYPILFSTVFLMQGLKRPAYGLWIGLYRQVLAPLLMIHMLVYVFGWGLWGVWWGVCIVNWSAAFFALWWGRMTVRAGLEIQGCAQSA